MENINNKLILAALSVLILSGCQNHTKPPTYYPGYYQEAKYHPARYERPYYDYYGNYHAGYIAAPYEEAGRWHRAAIITTDNIGKTAYIVDPVQMEQLAEKDAAHIAADRNTVDAVVK